MNTIKTTIQDQQKIKVAFWLLVALIIASAIAYFLIINKTVFNIVASEKAQSVATSLTSAIGQLQSANIALNDQITPEYAASLGFTQDTDPQYVSYLGSGSNLSFNTLP